MILTSAIPSEGAEAPVNRRYHDAVPSRHTAPELESIPADKLSEARFRRDFVSPWRPCRIEGAIRHWPATKLWASPDYLTGRVGAEREVVVRTHPRIGYPTTKAQHQQNVETQESMPFGEFLRRAAAPKSGHLALQSYVIGGELTSPGRNLFSPARLSSRRHGHQFEYRSLPGLGADVDGFYFLPRVRPPRAYPPFRTFVFRNTYTDWHWHGTDETLMCQVVGAKEVLVMPPDERSWRVLAPIMKEHGRTFDDDFTSSFAKSDWSGLRRTVVRPGDALYIPPYWWHSVEALEPSMGMTVAACWGTAVTAAGSGDLRYPAAREILGNLLRRSTAASIVPNAATVAVAVGASLARRLAGSRSR